MKNYAPINVTLVGGGGGQDMGWGFGIFQNFAVKFPAHGKSFQSNATEFPHPGLHIAVKYPKAGPKKGTIKIPPNKTRQSSSILRNELKRFTPGAILSFGKKNLS